jgi:CelD/BcsL family acetyltransferase involved in cellulose biosynthesis
VRSGRGAGCPAEVTGRVLRLERVPLEDADWEAIDAFGDRNVFQTPAWLEFVARTQPVEPVIARLERGGDSAGWFTGLVVRRFGVRILGSPFQGWTTGPMGFNLVPGTSLRDALEALVPFAFKRLRCLHLEVLDRRARFDELEGIPGRLASFHTFELDLARDEEAIFGGMSSACRRAVRKSEKEGVRVEEAHGLDFADEYYAQLEDVFAKQSLRPPYGVERVRELVRCVEPTGNLLLLRAVSPEGERIATGIFPVLNRFGYFWGGASWRQHQILRPNEAVFWYAMRRLRERGIPLLDMGGGGDYKRKYGPREFTVPSFRKARLPGLLHARDLAERLARRRLRRTGARDAKPAIA